MNPKLRVKINDILNNKWFKKEDDIFYELMNTESNIEASNKLNTITNLKNSEVMQKGLKNLKESNEIERRKRISYEKYNIDCGNKKEVKDNDNKSTLITHADVFESKRKLNMAGNLSGQMQSNITLSNSNSTTVIKTFKLNKRINSSNAKGNINYK